MALQINVTEPATGTPIPRGYVRLQNAHLTLSTDYVDATLALYYSAATAAAGKNPVSEYPQFTLTSEEINAPNPAFVKALGDLVAAGKIASPKDALKACLYVLLRGRSEFKDALDV